nr:hypothetical protein [Tanacetum cinerariifolium]
MDKKKRFKLTLEIFRDIFKICPRVQYQDFDALPTDEEIVSFLRELRHTGEINSLDDFKKPASPQLTTVPVSPEEPTKKSKRVKRSAKKSSKAPAGGVVIRETHDIPLSKKKEKSLRDFHNTHLSGFGNVTKTAPTAAKIKPSVTNKGTGVKPKVSNVTEEESSESEAESWGNDKDDSNNEQNSRNKGSDEENDSDDKNTPSDSEKGSDSEHETDENESDFEFDQEENEEEIGDYEEEKEDEFVRTPSNDSDDETKMSDKAIKRWIILPVNYTMMWIYSGMNQLMLMKGLIKSYELNKTLLSTYDKVYSLKRRQKDKDKNEDPFAGSDRGLKKRKTSKNAESIKGPKAKESQHGSSKGTNSQIESSRKFVQSEEPEFKVADSNMPQDQEENPGDDDEEPKGKRDQRKSFYGYGQGLESTHDVYSTKRILAVTRVEVMRKHGYGYLK